MPSFDFTAANGTALNTLNSNWLGLGGRGDTNWEVQGNAAKETAAVVGNFEDPAGMVYDTSDSDVSEVTLVDAEQGNYCSPAVRCGTASNEWGYSFTFNFSAGNFDGATLDRDRNFVVFQSVAGGDSALNVDIRIESTTNGSQVDVELFINDTSRGTFTDSSGSRITSLRDGSGFIAYNQGSSDIEFDAWNDGDVGASAPVLTAPTEVSITGTTATVGCTTDTGPDGTLYWFVSTSATAPSSAALKAGTGATASGSTATPSIGANTFSVTGLTAATTYYTYFVHEDTEGDSNLLESGSWATIDASASPAFSVQHFTQDASDGDTVTLATAVTLANAIVLNGNNRYQSAGPNGSSGNQSSDDISGGLELTGTSTVTVRAPTAVDTRFSGSVWEYVGDSGGDHEFIVLDRQAHVLSSATRSTTFTLVGQAANIAEIVPIISGIENDHTGAGGHNATADISLAVSGSDVLATITRGGSENTTTVYVQYVRFSGSSWTVHTGSAASAAADTGTITLGSSVTSWADALIWMQHRGDTGNANQAIADNYPLAEPGAALDEVDYQFDANHDGVDGLNRVWVLENTDLVVTRFSNTSSIANEFTVDVTSAALTTVDEAFVIGFAESSGSGTAYGRAWKNFYLNSATQVGQYCHRSGNTMNNRFQVVDLAGLTFSAGGGSITLILADTSQAPTVDALSLTQGYNLALQDAAQAQSVDVVSLTQGYNLTTADVSQSVGLDAVTLTQSVNLATQDVTQSQAVENIALTQAVSLALEDALQTATADSVVVTQASVLAIADIAQASSLDALTLSQSISLAVAEAAQATAADGLTLIQANVLALDDISQSSALDALTLATAGNLSVADATQGSEVDSVALNQANTLVTQDIGQAASVDAISLAQGLALSTEDVSQAQSVDAVEITQDSTLIIADITQAQTVDEVALASGLNISLNDALQAISADAVVLTQAHTVSVNDATQSTTIDPVALTQDAALIVADSLQGITADTPTLSFGITVSPEDAQQQINIDAVALSQSASLVLEDAIQAQTADNITLSQGFSLTLADSLQVVGIDAIGLIVGSLVVPTNRVFVVSPQADFDVVQDGTAFVVSPKTEFTVN